MNKPRVLTHDEVKASEAAFRGRPFNQKWSKAARRVYDGLLGVLGGATPIVTPDIAPLPEGELTDMTVEMLNELEPESVVLSDSDSFGGGDTALLPPPNHITSREDAVKAGLVVDVTQVAKHFGLHLSVGITKSLWEKSITGPSTISPESWKDRVRDMLLAVRLRLASLESPTPWIEVPVLLPVEEKEAPKLFPIYALFHKDPVVAECLTLIHPQEISSINMSSFSSGDDSSSEGSDHSVS